MSNAGGRRIADTSHLAREHVDALLTDSAFTTYVFALIAPSSVSPFASMGVTINHGELYQTRTCPSPSWCFTPCTTSRGTVLPASCCCSSFMRIVRPPATSATWATKPLSTRKKWLLHDQKSSMTTQHPLTPRTKTFFLPRVAAEPDQLEDVLGSHRRNLPSASTSTYLT